MTLIMIISNWKKFINDWFLLSIQYNIQIFYFINLNIYNKKNIFLYLNINYNFIYIYLKNKN